MSDTESEDTRAENSATDQPSGTKRWEKRVEEWLYSLKDEAEQRTPEVLSGLAATAKDVASYLENMAEQVRSRQEHEKPAAPEETAESQAIDEHSQGAG
jgi:hypothetical protein